ncbi:MAG: hypothetical protein WCF93_04645 [Candidatus Moraniibacteriota bacterium]
MKKEKLFNAVTQFALPILTISGQLAIALKYPHWGLLLALISEPFWLYSTWKSYKQVGQIGMFFNTVVFTVVTIVGLVNYWIL